MKLLFKGLTIIILFISFLLLPIIANNEIFTSEDLFIPDQCDAIAKAGDHLLIEYSITYSNGSTGANLKRPAQLYHVLLESKVIKVVVILYFFTSEYYEFPEIL